MDHLAVWSETGKPVSSWRHCGPTQQTHKGKPLLTPCINQVIRCNMTTTTPQPFTALSRDHPDEPVPEENLWTLRCKGRLTEADTPTVQLGTTPSGPNSAYLHHSPIFYRPDALPAAQPTVSKHWRQRGLLRKCWLSFTDNNRNDKWNWLLFHLNGTLPWIPAVLELWRTTFIFENSYLQIQGGQLWIAQHGGWIQIGPMHVSQNTAKMSFIFKHNFNWVTH